MDLTLKISERWKAIAKDKDGRVFIYEKEPHIRDGKTSWNTNGEYASIADLIDTSMFKDVWWRNSLLIRDEDSGLWVPEHPEEWQSLLTLEEIEELPLEAQVISLKAIAKKYYSRTTAEGG